MIARTEEQDSNPRTGGWRWPLIVGGLLAIHAAFLFSVLLFASTDRSFAVEPDYYSKAIAWDQTREQERTNESLGWTAVALISEPSGVLGDRTLDYRLVDRDLLPIVGATVSIEAFHHARGNDRLEETLPEIGEGRYALKLPIRRPGLWEVRLTVERGEDRFTQTDEITVARASR